MANIDAQWKKFKEKIKAKRVNKCGSKNPKTVTTELTVQRLSSEVSGKAQKYSRIGPREFVPFPEANSLNAGLNTDSQELTLQNIIKACEVHFLPQLGSSLKCDVLAGEQGPSCQTTDQIPDTKVIYVRFIPKSQVTFEEPVTYISSGYASVVSSEHMHVAQPNNIEDGTREPKLARYSYPRSLSITDMLKLGKLSEDQESTVINLYHFDMDLLVWAKIPQVVEFMEEKVHFGEGGFRKAYKATTKHKDFSENMWVVKRYLPQAIKCIEEIGATPKQHTQKVVQMHHLAKNFAHQLRDKVEKEQLNLFGGTFEYSKIFYGTTDMDEHVTVEEFVPGIFVKYLNNDGISCTKTEMGQKAESLSHFSYEKSNGKLLLVDVQGNGYKLFDPEIASADLYDKEKKEILYCAGNLANIAIDNFLNMHKCNAFCNIIGLKSF